MYRPYIYPLDCESFVLEFPWTPYDDVRLFITTRNFEDVVAWYQEHLPEVEAATTDGGFFECSFQDASVKKEVSVWLADGRIREARDLLLERIGSRALGDKVLQDSPATVGAVLFHKSHEQRRKEYEEERAETASRRQRKVTFETVRLASATALAQKDYQRFIALLEPYTDLFDDGLQKKYDLVKQKSGNAQRAFLTPTPTIDSDHPTIIAAAADIAGDATDDEDIARRCFLWVRDQVRHSSDSQLPTVTCTASDVLKHRVGFCYAKSHLLAALLRARGIPAALCYQRLAFDDSASSFFLHGLVAIHLSRHGWYRVDPRGNKPGVFSDFTPPLEKLPYTPRLPGEADLPDRYPDALACVVSTLTHFPTAQDVRAHLPDYPPEV